jgi:hypothetical protein
LPLLQERPEREHITESPGLTFTAIEDNRELHCGSDILEQGSAMANEWKMSK